MSRVFRLLQNTFESQTRNNYKKALSIVSGTVDKLAANHDMVDIHAQFLPHYEAYRNIYSAVGLLEGTYKGKTNLFASLMENLKPELRKWEGRIRAVFPEDTSAEVEIFPKKRKPFQSGTYEQRLGTLKALSKKLLEYTGDHADLVPVQAEVAAYHALCLAARSTQQGKEGDLKTLRTQREQQRVNTMNAFMGIVYSGLVSKFYTNMKMVGVFIDFGRLYGSKNVPNVVASGRILAQGMVYADLKDAKLSASVNITFQSTFNIADSDFKAQFQASADAPFDSTRNHIFCRSLLPAIDHAAADAGYDTAKGMMFLMLYAGDNEVAFKVEVEQ